MRQIILFLTFLIPLFGCKEINTSNPIECYTLWAGEDPTQDIKIEHGQYWQSAHLTKEYELYLRFKAANDWWEQFTHQNQLVGDYTKTSLLPDHPVWFNPSKNARRWRLTDKSNPSHYFYDHESNTYYIYEIQL